MNDPKTRYTEITDKLREKGYKITPQRLAIVEVLTKSEGHPSIEEIYKELERVYPTMSLATVYRNVILLKSLGEVFEVGFADDKNRYDGNKPYPHPHLVCVECKKIIDAVETGSSRTSENLASDTGFEIIGQCYFGICPDCGEEE
ncbi:MAG: transcriptional repressor [bacterium]|nr:transcriptional repressor [bacterium]